MTFFKNETSFFGILITILLWGCIQDTQWKGQAPLKKVSTLTVPIQLQHRGVFDLGDGVFMTNDYLGARLNGVSKSNDSLISVLITPENSPINPSPWYGFKIWSETDRDIYLRLTYSENAFHRYYPKLSSDGKNWKSLDSANSQLKMKLVEEKELPISLTMKISISKDTLWISAQELETSTTVNTWANDLMSKSFVSNSTIGESREGKPINLLKIGKSDDKKMIMIISRQHPPEVTGFLAMKSFINTICSDSEIAEKFRSEYNVYVVPLMNPDGVDNGHWRHSSGGIDLNRDWEDFNQPETSAIKNFMERKAKENDGKFYFGADFHSTYQDIFYTIDPNLKGNMPGLVPDLINELGKEIPNYNPNIRPSPGTGLRVNSTAFFFHEFGAESVTYEVGDNTPREFVRRKGEITAQKLMELMLKN
ncbi:MAG: M14 family metallopeptidase [Ekhidna sp.]